MQPSTSAYEHQQRQRLQQTQALRRTLMDLGYHEPLHDHSVGLTATILRDLLKTQEELRAARTQVQSQAKALASVDGHANFQAVRLQVGALTRENADLHARNIALVEEATVAQRYLRNELELLHTQLKDGAFLSAELHRSNQRLERENAGLRDACNTSFEVNGVVLPSGQEVRWHGRKQHMQAHSPVAPARPARSRGGAAEAYRAGAMVPAEVPAQLVRAAETQLSTLLGRCEGAEERAAHLEGQLAKARAALGARDAEVYRLAEQLAESREGEGSAGRLAQDEAASSAISQMNHQVNFLNETCAQLQEALTEERERNRKAERLTERLAQAMRREKEAIAREVGVSPNLQPHL
jgi:DNA repair exonuclease SbcCD ATPase subunit